MSIKSQPLFRSVHHVGSLIVQRDFGGDGVRGSRPRKRSDETRLAMQSIGNTGSDLATSKSVPSSSSLNQPPSLPTATLSTQITHLLHPGQQPLGSNRPVLTSAKEMKPRITRFCRSPQKRIRILRLPCTSPSPSATLPTVWSAGPSIRC